MPRTIGPAGFLGVSGAHFAPPARRARVFTPYGQLLPSVSQVNLVPAGSGASYQPQTVILETAAGPPTRVRLPPADGSASAPYETIFPDLVVMLRPAGSGGQGAVITIRIPIPVPPQPVLPAWQRDVQHWAIHQERQRHAQALWQYGELAIFVLMWTTLEEKAGLVGRCQRCFTGTRNVPLTVPPAIADVGGSASQQAAEAAIAAAYGQGNQWKCPDCFGTQFEGGFRAMIVRPAIFSDLDKNQQRTARGVVNTGQTGIETTPDFRVRAGDFCFRQNGMRLKLRVPRRTTLRTGFATPYQQSAAIDYNLLQADLEDPASVAYIIPPSAVGVAEVLGSYTRLPVDFSWFEIIRAPLIVEDIPTPASSGALQPSVTYPLEVQ